VANEAACRDSYVLAQHLAKAGRLKRARQHALSCGQDRCSVTIRTDCSRWLEEISQAMPTLVVVAKKRDGSLLRNVSVRVGNELLARQLDGRAMAVDPGAHELRIRFGDEEKRVSVLALEGQKFQLVNVVLGTPGTAARGLETSAQTLAGASVAAPGEPAVWSRPALWFATGAMLSATAFAVLGGVGYSRERELRSACGKTESCSRADVDGVHRLYTLADVFLGAGVVFGAGAVGLWAVSGGQAHSEPSGARITLRGSF
jgi:hypothetical protein